MKGFQLRIAYFRVAILAYCRPLSNSYDQHYVGINFASAILPAILRAKKKCREKLNILPMLARERHTVEIAKRRGKLKLNYLILDARFLMRAIKSGDLIEERSKERIGMIWKTKIRT